MNIIDKDKLKALYGHDETAQDIITMFVDRSDQLLEELSLAINEPDPSILAKVCHKGIGQARYIGSPLLEEAIIDLQKAPQDKKEVHYRIIEDYIKKINHEYS